MNSGPQFPQRFGPYVLERFLAAGGMAEVFVASRPDGRVPGPIALKRMLPQMMENPEYATMFRDEAVLASRLVHPNIVRVWDSGEYDGRLYMAMELVDGLDAASLQKKLRSRGEVLSVPLALRVGVELCNGLAAAHTCKDERGVALMLIHRDVSPQNILLDRAGGVKVTDFGVAKATGRETHTATGNIKGKIPYMAPEQALAQHIDQRVDQFAAGIVVWELLTGQRLFVDKNDLLMFEKIIRRPTPKPSSVRPGVSGAIDMAVLRALAKNPDERFPDVAAFGRALQQALSASGGCTQDDIAAIVDYVLPPPDAVAPGAATTVDAAVAQRDTRPSQRATGAGSSPSQPSRPTGAPMPAAIDDEATIARPYEPEVLQRTSSQPSNAAPAGAGQVSPPPPPPLLTGSSAWTPQPAPSVVAAAPSWSPPPSPSPPSPSSQPPPPAQRGRMAVVAANAPLPSQVPPQTSAHVPSQVASAPSQASAAGLTLDRSRARAPRGVEVAGASPSAPVPVVAVPADEPRAPPWALLGLVLVVGAGAGFAGGRFTAPRIAETAGGDGCARPSQTPGDIEAAYDMLLKSQMQLESGDLQAAALRANEAQARSGTAKGHFMLGQIRLASGDVASALAHYRCVLQMAPGGDEAKAVLKRLQATK